MQVKNVNDNGGSEGGELVERSWWPPV